MRSKDELRFWTETLSNGQLSRRRWLQLALGAGVGLPAIAEMLAGTGSHFWASFCGHPIARVQRA